MGEKGSGFGEIRMTAPSPADRDLGQYRACRRLWAKVALTVLEDAWNAIRRKDADIPRIRAEALRYFRSRDGRAVLSLAGITASPERLADAAVDFNARDRTKALPGFEEAA